MKLTTDYRIRIAGILLLTIINFSFSSFEALAGVIPGSFKLYASNFLIGLVPSVTLWECIRLFVIFYNRKYALQPVTAKRLGREAALVFLLSIIIYCLLLPVITFTDDTNPPVVYLAYGLLTGECTE